MKRVFSFLLLLMILFLGIEFLVTMFTKEYIVNYVVMINDKKSNVKEMYQKNMDNIYDIEINIDNNNFYYLVKNNFNKQKHVIKDILYFEDNNDICIYPILKDDSGSYIECIRDNKLYIGNSFPNQNLVTRIKNELTKYNNFKEDGNTTKYGNKYVYSKNVNVKDNIVLWEYKNLWLITYDDYQTISSSDFDIYDNRLGTLVDKYYVLPNYTNDKVLEFDEAKIFNVLTGKDDTIKLKYTLSSGTYVNGVINNKLYLTDPSNLLQVEVNILNKSSRLVGSVELGGLMYDGKWDSRNIYDFKSEIKYTEDLSKINNYQYNELKYSKAAYYFYDNNGDVYQVLKNHPEVRILLFNANKINNFNVVDNDIYYVIGDTLYYYSASNGIVKVLIDNDLLYNSNNRISIYRKDS